MGKMEPDVKIQVTTQTIIYLIILRLIDRPDDDTNNKYLYAIEV